MPSKSKVTPQKEPVLAKEGPEALPDRPLLDLLDAAVKKLIRTAKKLPLLIDSIDEGREATETSTCPPSKVERSRRRRTTDSAAASSIRPVEMPAPRLLRLD